MMKFFTNKKIWEKIILALLFVMLFQFAVMKPVEADVVEFGGKLLSPVMSLLVSLGDGVMNILHSTIMGIETPLIHIENDKRILGNIFTDSISGYFGSYNGGYSGIYWRFRVSSYSSRIGNV